MVSPGLQAPRDRSAAADPQLWIEQKLKKGDNDQCSPHVNLLTRRLLVPAGLNLRLLVTASIFVVVA